MKAILTILAVLAFAAAAQAQTVVLDYDMSKTPDQQGFELNVSCGTVWNATGTMLEFRGCRPGGPAFAVYPSLFLGVSTARVDMRMRILDSDGYAFEAGIAGPEIGYYFQLTAANLNNDNDWHDVTFFVDFVNNTATSYIDGTQASVEKFFIPFDMFVIGEGNTGDMWGDVDISLLKVTTDSSAPVADELTSWGSVKSLYR
jgi:hypothetical protein